MNLLSWVFGSSMPNCKQQSLSEQSVRQRLLVIDKIPMPSALQQKNHLCLTKYFECFSQLLAGNYYCTCINSYTGTNCDVSLYANVCSSQPCQNGGTCQQIGSGYVCNCVYPYSGTLCQNCPVTNPCSSFPCQNGGTCQQVGTGYVCNCVFPYSGPQCKSCPITFNPCSSNPCQNGGLKYKQTVS